MPTKHDYKDNYDIARQFEGIISIGVFCEINKSSSSKP